MTSLVDMLNHSQHYEASLGQTYQYTIERNLTTIRHRLLEIVCNFAIVSLNPSLNPTMDDAFQSDHWHVIEIANRTFHSLPDNHFRRKDRTYLVLAETDRILRSVMNFLNTLRNESV